MSCLGEDSRFRLVSLLLMRGQSCVTELAEGIGLSQSCTTRHLQALARERLVAGERRGKRVMFRLRTDDPKVGALLAWALSGRAFPGSPQAPLGGAALHLDRAPTSGAFTHARRVRRAHRPELGGRADGVPPISSGQDRPTVAPSPAREEPGPEEQPAADRAAPGSRPAAALPASPIHPVPPDAEPTPDEPPAAPRRGRFQDLEDYLL